MLDSTKTAIKAICATDPSITREMIAQALRALNGEQDTAAREAPDRLLSRREVASLLNVNVKSVTNYAKRGLIRRMALGVGGKYATGYSEASVRALLEGKVA